MAGCSKQDVEDIMYNNGAELFHPKSVKAASPWPLLGLSLAAHCPVQTRLPTAATSFLSAKVRRVQRSPPGRTRLHQTVVQNPVTVSGIGSRMF